MCGRVLVVQAVFRLVRSWLTFHLSPQQAAGVGRLVFETVRGVRGRLQVEAAAVLRVQFELLGAPKLPAELVQQALTAALLAAAAHVTREHAEPMWTELWVRAVLRVF